MAILKRSHKKARVRAPRCGALEPEPQWRSCKQGMARREVTQIFDDLDNSPLEEKDVRVIRFSVNGTDYVLDVSEKNAAAFHAQLAPYINAARKVPSLRGRKPGAIAPYDPREVRQWASKNGYAVARRGKISQEIIDAYLAVTS